MIIHYKNKPAKISFDFWNHGKNLLGGIGAIKDRKLDSAGKISSTNDIGNYISPIIPFMGTDLEVGNAYNVISGYAYIYNNDGAYVTKKNIEQILDKNTGILLHRYDYQNMVLSIKTFGDITIQAKTPERPYDIDGDEHYAFMKNVHYPSNDMTYSEILEYVPSGLTHGEKPVNLPIPYMGDVGYTIKISDKPDMSRIVREEYFDAYRPYFAVRYLCANKAYWYSVNGLSMSMSVNGTVRNVNISGATNTRDIGNKKSIIGGMVKQGLLYRSGRLDNITEEGKDTIDALGIKFELDLRQSEEEVPEGYEPYLEYDRVATGDITLISKGYADTSMANVLRKIIECLEAKKPVIFHCRGGADRTGKVAACCLGVLGVSTSEISKDYELTSFDTHGCVRSDLDDTAHHFGTAMLQIQKEEGRTTADKWETVLKRAGVTDDEIYRFRCLMLEDYG